MPSWAEKLSKSAKFHSENGRFGKAFQKWFFWHRWEDPLEAKFYVILSWRPHLFSPAKKARFDSRARFKPPGLDLSLQGCFYVTERSMQTLQLQLQFSCSIIPLWQKPRFNIPVLPICHNNTMAKTLSSSIFLCLYLTYKKPSCAQFSSQLLW